jgi:hypothetical protein
MRVLSGSQYVGGVNTAAEMILSDMAPNALQRSYYGLYYMYFLMAFE